MSYAQKLETIQLGCEVDRGLRRIYFRSMDLPKDQIIPFIRNCPILRYESDITLNEEAVDPASPCWILRVDQLNASFSVSRKAQLAVAEAIGLLPVQLYEGTEHEDVEYIREHRKDFMATCRYSRIPCVRPSHLRISDTSRRPVETQLTHAELVILWNHQSSTEGS